MTIRALIFDFDGTILDTESADFVTWQEIYARHNCSLTMDAWSRCVGTTYHSFNPFDHLEEQLGRAISRDEIAREHRDSFVARVEAQQLLQGVEQCIAVAQQQGLKLGLASSSQRHWVHGHLKQHNLFSHFQSIKTAEDVTEVKPAPELYVAVLRELQVAAKEAVAIEDSPNGVTAAKRAGIYCVAVPNSVTAQLSLDHADMQLAQLCPDALREILKGG